MPASRGRTTLLWSMAALFAVFTVATTLNVDLISPGLTGIINTVLLVAFALVHGGARYGAKTIAAFVVICLVVSNVFENLSIVTGFPFGHYHYTDVLGPKLLLVPVTIGGAYFGAGYLAWSVAQILVWVRWAQPLAAAILMASWDFMLDPGASTINHYWIWEQGGGYFGVPLTNYLGWLLTVIIVFACFAWYLTRYRPPAAPVLRRDRGYWALPIAMYALLGVRYFLIYWVPSANTPFTDAAGHVWLRHDIYATTALAAIFSVFAFSAFAWLRLHEAPVQREP